MSLRGLGCDQRLLRENIEQDGNYLTLAGVVPHYVFLHRGDSHQRFGSCNILVPIHILIMIS